MHLPRTISLQLFEKVWVSCTATQELQIIPKKLLKILVPCLGCSSFNGQVNWKSQTCEQKKKEPTLGSNWLLTSIQNFYWEMTWVSTKSVRIFESNNEILTNRIFSHYAWINSLPQKLVMKNLQTHQVVHHDLASSNWNSSRRKSKWDFRTSATEWVF